MEKKYLLSLDNGGSMTKCVIFDTSGNQIASAGQHLPLITPAPGMTERDMGDVWRANAEVTRQAIEKSGIDPKAIAAVGLTGYGNGICFVDENGEPTYNAVVSTDNRGQPYVNECRQSGLEEKVYELTRQGLWSAQFAPLLKWFATNEPGVLAKSKCFLGIKDYVRYMLTGELCMEVTESSSSDLMNIYSLEWDQRLFDLMGMSEYFRLAPKCIGVADVGGIVTEAAERITGIPAGTPVSGSCFDVDGGLLASGILDCKTLCMIAGTWSINEHLTDELKYGYNETTNSLSMSFLPGHYLVEESTPTSASNFDWFVEEFLVADRPGLKKGDLYKECDDIVTGIAPEESDVVFVPYLFASATHPDAKAAFFNLTGYHERKHVIRAIYEGVVFSSLWHVKRLQTDGRHFTSARLSGGLTNSEVWTQMMADALQMPVEVLAAPELSAMGATMCAGIGCGLFKDFEDAVDKMVRVDKVYQPNPEKAEIYAKKFHAYEKAQAALEVFHDE